MRFIKSPLFLFVLFNFSVLVSQAQIGGTMNTMSELFQAGYTNPAKVPSSAIHLGLPVASGFASSIINTGFSYYGLPKKGDKKTINRFLNKLGGINYFQINSEVDLATFGIRLKKGFFSVTIREKLLFRITYPGDLLKVLVQGNGGELLGERTNLDGFGFDINHYKEVGIGFAQKFGDRFSFGARGKFLFGYENLKTIETKLGLTTLDGEFDNYQIELDGKVNMISSGINSLASAPSNFNPLDYLTASSNKGFAVDLGMEVKATDYITLSASVIDLGGILYTKDIRNLKTDDISFTFDGVDVFNFIEKKDTADQAQQTILDSLDNAFALDESNEKYYASLNGKIFFGGELTLFKKNVIGAFATSEFIKGRIKPSFSGYYATNLLPNVRATINYSIANRSVTNFGAGITANIGSGQFYLVTDNLIGITFPARARTIDVRAGINLRFGNGLKHVKEISNRKAEKTLMMID
ncbi:MAG: hypothetical protein ACJAY8_000074 [Sphingobacteriales bacterium]|jgi:hypothetical protein